MHVIAGRNVGAAVTPAMMAGLYVYLSWRGVFLLFGLLGLLNYGSNLFGMDKREVGKFFPVRENFFTDASRMQPA